MFAVRSRIVITSRSPLKNFWQDYRVEFVAIDFLKPIEEIIQKLAPFCTDVTHAFFTSYAHTDDFERLRDLNVPLFENFLTAIDKVASGSLERICLQTGGKVSCFTFSSVLCSSGSGISTGTTLRTIGRES